jgi:DNA-directed RNA polymerase beta' subunit
MLGTSKITAIKFSHYSSEDILKGSHALITSPDLFRGSVPYDGGVYDAHLGTTGHDYNCATCGSARNECKGHPGHIKCNQPIMSPLVIMDIRRWCKVICFSCGELIINISSIKASKQGLLDAAAKYVGTTVRRCIKCSAPHPIIKKNPIEPLGIIASNPEDLKNPKYDLLPHMIKQIFGRISNETVIKTGRSIDNHPFKYILDYIYVPTVIIRPDTKKIGGARSANDDLTTMIQHMIKCNDQIPSTIPANYGPDYVKLIFNLQNALNDFIKAKGESAPTSISKRIKGKSGRARKNQLGKRVFEIARSTIVGDPTLAIDELGVPIDFAKKLYVEEIVQDYNKPMLLSFCLNGTKKYPGASKIIRQGVEYNVDTIKDIELESGDIVLRDLIDGDYVYFNRQPSLMSSNISCMRVRVTRDAKNKTLMMNVIVCKLFNADFDGDYLLVSVTIKLVASGCYY